MSEWAIGEGHTRERTAYEYRELYLDQGLEFKPFNCPFCGVPLTSVNVYTLGEIAKSPHFRAKEPHRFECDGWPKGLRTRDDHPPEHRVEKREFYLPEALVPRREPITTRLERCGPGAGERPDEQEVDRRRQEAAGRLGPAIYRTSLIRSVAIAFLGVLKESYKQQKNNDWTGEQRQKWVADLLKASDLTMYDGYRLTYKSAIRNTRFPPPSKPRIFEGWASVGCDGQADEAVDYQLIPHMLVEEKQDEVVRRYPVEITLRVTHSDEPTGSQRTTFERLDKAVREGLVARWFAYGVMLLHDDGIYRMQMDNVDHLYLHTLRKPIN